MLPVQPPAEVRPDPVREALDVVSAGLASGRTRGLRAPLDAARRSLIRTPEGPQALRAEVLHGLLLAAERREREGDEVWARAVRRLHGQLLSQRPLKPEARIPVMEVLHEALERADLEDYPVREALLEARLARSATFDPALESECLKLLEHHYRGWLDPRPPDLPRLLPMAKVLSHLWMRLPAPPRTERVVQRALRISGAEGVWTLVARSGDGELLTLAAQLLETLDPAFLDPGDGALWRTLMALDKQGWRESVRRVRRGMEARLAEQLRAQPRNVVLMGQAARWHLCVEAPREALDLCREALAEPRLQESVRSALLATFGAAALAVGDPATVREARNLGCVLAASPEPPRPDPVRTLRDALAREATEPSRLMVLAESCMGQDTPLATEAVAVALKRWALGPSDAPWPLERVQAMVWAGCMAVAEGRSKEGLQRIREALDGLPLVPNESFEEARKTIGDSVLMLDLVPHPARLIEVLPLLDMLVGRMGTHAGESVLFPREEGKIQRWRRRAELAGRVAFIWE